MKKKILMFLLLSIITIITLGGMSETKAVRICSSCQAGNHASCPNRGYTHNSTSHSIWCCCGKTFASAEMHYKNHYLNDSTYCWICVCGYKEKHNTSGGHCTKAHCPYRTSKTLCDRGCNHAKWVNCRDHSYSSTWSRNSTHHWKKCIVTSSCSVKKSYAVHVDSNEDGKCDVCELNNSSGGQEGQGGGGADETVTTSIPGKPVVTAGGKSFNGTATSNTVYANTNVSWKIETLDSISKRPLRTTEYDLTGATTGGSAISRAVRYNKSGTYFRAINWTNQTIPSSHTIEFWIYIPMYHQGTSYIFQTSYANSGVRNNQIHLYKDGQMLLRSSQSGAPTTGNNYITYDDLIALGFYKGWSYVSAQVETGKSFANGVQIWINGKKANMKLNTSTTYKTEKLLKDIMFMGGYYRNTNIGLPDGSMLKEVKVMSGLLASSSSERMYKKMVSGVTGYTSLLAYYPMEETSGSTAYTGMTSGGVNGVYTTNSEVTYTTRDVGQYYTGLPIDSNSQFTGIISNEGTTKITANHIGMNGAVSETTVDVVIDKTAPSGLIYGETAFTNKSSIKLYAVANDELSGVDKVNIVAWTGKAAYDQTCSTKVATYNSSTELWEVSYNFSEIVNTTTGSKNQGEGTYYFKAHIYDKAGNRVIVGPYTVGYDTTSPWITGAMSTQGLTGSEPTFYTRNVTSTVTLNNTGIADNLSGPSYFDYYIRRDGAARTTEYNAGQNVDETTGTGYVKYKLNGQGTYISEKYIYDRAGNSAKCEDITIIADNEGPWINQGSVSGATKKDDGKYYVTDATGEVTLNYWDMGDNLSGLSHFDYYLSKDGAARTKDYNTGTAITTDGGNKGYVKYKFNGYGTYTTEIYIYDKAGNLSTNDVKTFVVAPDGSEGVIYTEASLTNKPTVKISVEAKDDNSGVNNVKIYAWKGTTRDGNNTLGQGFVGGDATYNSTTGRWERTFTFSELPDRKTCETNQGDGIYAFDAHVVNNSGTDTYIEPVHVTYDATAPEIYSITYAPGWTNKAITKNVEARDNLSGVRLLEYSYDLNTWYSDWDSAGTGTATKTWDGERDEVLYFRATDYAGNTWVYAYDGVHPSPYDLKIDKTLPTGTVSASARYTNQNLVKISVAAQDALSGVDRVRIIAWTGSKDWVTTNSAKDTIYNEETGLWEVTFTFDEIKDTTTGALNQGDGNYYFGAHIYDKAANRRIVDGTIVTYDTTPPQITSVTSLGANEWTWKNQNITKDIKAQDDLSGVGLIEYSYDLNTWYSDWDSTAVGEASRTWTEEGKRSVYFRAKDNAGNIGVHSTDGTNPTAYCLWLDKTKPAIGTYTISGTTVRGGRNYVTNNAAEITLNFTGLSDNLSGISRFDVYMKKDGAVRTDAYNLSQSIDAEAGTGTVTYKLNGYGTYTTEIYLYDVAGNVAGYQNSVIEAVESIPLPELMERDLWYYEDEIPSMLGARRADPNTTYLASKVKTISIINLTKEQAPATYEATWDVSYIDGQETVTAWVVKNSEDATMYDLIIGANDVILVPENAGYLFAYYENLESIEGLNNFDTSNMTTTESMFEGCTIVPNIDISTFNTSEVETMINMFLNCSGLTKINLSNLNTTKVTSMSSMFSGCASLENIDLENLDTANVTDMSSMFSGCSSLKSIDLRNLNTVNVTTMGYIFENCDSLKDIKLSGLDTSNLGTIEGMFTGATSLETVDLSDFDMTPVIAMSYLFKDCTNLKYVDLKNAYVPGADPSLEMFRGCTNLTSIRLGENFNTLNPQDAFSGCTNLKAIIVESETPLTLDTTGGLSTLTNAILYVPSQTAKTTYESATNYSTVFGADRIRPILGVVGDNPVKAKQNGVYDATVDAGATIAGFTKAESSNYTQYGYDYVTSGLPVDTTTTGTKQVTYTLTKTENGATTNGMSVTRDVKVVGVPKLMERESSEYISGTGTVFYAIGARRSDNKKYTADLISSITFVNNVNVPTEAEASWDASYTNGDNEVIAWVIPNATDSTKYDLYIGADDATIQAPENSYHLFYTYSNCVAINNLAMLDTSNVIIMSDMFSNCSSLSALDVSAFNTSNVTNMACIFWGCSNLSNLDVSNFNTSNVIDMCGMFDGCSKLKVLDLSNFDTANVANMSYMFSDCRNLVNLDLNNFNTANVTNMRGMFQVCSSLTSLNVSSFNTSSVTDMCGMFQVCSSLTSLDVSNFNTSKVTDISIMFNNCSGLTDLNVSKFDTSNVTDMNRIFASCSGLTSLDLSNFDTSNVTNMNYMFNNCSGLNSLKFGANFDKLTGASMFSGCSRLKAIITPRTSIMTLNDEATTSTGLKTLTNAVLYVPTVNAEATFEADANYADIFGADRIRPILELVGDNPAKVANGTIYTDAGVTVAGMTENADDTYTPYGYTVSGPIIKKGDVTVTNIDTSTKGTYTYTYTVVDPDGVSGMSVTRTVEIESADISENNLNITVTLPTEERVYKDAEYRPVVTVKDGTKTLTENTDFTVSYSDNINAGKATITITGINNYTGSRTENFMITQRPVTIKPKDASKEYDTLPLTSNVVEVTAGSLVSGHTVMITTTGSITNVGSVDNTISTLIIKNASGTDVTVNYNVTKAKGTLTVTSAGSVDFDITLNNNTFEYDGTAKEPTATVKVGSKTLVAGTDYDVSYKNNKDAGTATVTITGKGNYAGSIGTKNFTITKRVIEITASGATKTYDGTALTSSKFEVTSGSLAANQTLSVTTSGSITNVGSTPNEVATYKVMAGSEDVTKNYEVTTVNGTLTVTNATITGSVKITGNNIYGETLTAEVTVVPADCTLTYVWYMQRGQQRETITSATNSTLVLGSDQVGKIISVQVTAQKTNYNSRSFTDMTDVNTNGSSTVLQKDLTSPDIVATISPVTFVYSGAENKPTVTLYDNATLLAENTDYTVSYSNNIEVGTGIVTITGMGNYKGSIEKQFTITKASVTPKVNMAGYTYGGTKSTPSVTGNTGNGTVTYYYNTTNSSTNGTNWGTVTSSTSLNAGTYYMYAVISATTNYNGATTAAVPFIVAKRDVTIKPKDATKVYDTLPLTSNVAEVTAGSLVSGHTVTITTTGSITNVGSTENTISTLTIKNASGTDVTANYNVTKAKGTLTITSAGSVDFDITLNNNTFEYDGTAKEPTATVKVGGKTLVAGTDYDVSYKNNKDAGTATITITGKGNYAGSIGTKEFTITKRVIKITAGSSSKVYDGTALTSSKFEVTKGSLAPNQTLSVTTSGSITNVGSTPNKVATYKVMASSEDVTKNYTVTTVDGTLTVTSATITGSVKITGNNIYGETLTAEVTVVPADCTLTYVWYMQRGQQRETITGATNSTLVLGSDQVGKIISVQVTAQKTNYNSRSFTDMTDVNTNGSSTVLQKDLTSPDIVATISPVTFVYSGAENKPTVTLYDNATLLAENTDYTVSYSNNIEVGTGIVTITGMGNYKGSIEKQFTITKASVTPKVNMAGYTYGGTMSTPSVTGNTGNGTVTYYYNTTNSSTNGTNWSTVTSSTSLNAGTYYMYAVISATTNYNGATTAAVPFIVAKRDVTIKPKDATKVYDTLPLTSNVAEVTAGSLVSGHTVTITTTGSITNVGSTENTISTLTIKNASGTDVTANYNVTKAKGILTITSAGSVDFDITLDGNTFEYDGTEKEPTATVKVGGKTLVAGTDYDVSYKNNKDAGTATITITGKGNYAGSIGTKEFTITKRVIEITAGSSSKVYDGTALTSSKFTVTKGSVAANQTLSVTTSGSITNVGSTPNKVATYKVMAGSEDVTKNYEVTTVNGTLTVTNAKITGNVKITGTNTFGQTLTASVTTVPTGCTLTYDWYYATTSTATSGTSIGTGSTVVLNSTAYIGKYVFVKVTASKANYDMATFTDVTDAENNGSATVKDASVVITTNPANVAVKEGTTASFSVVASGTNLKYQWYKASSSTGAGTAITGATNATYTISASEVVRGLNGTYYYCIVSNTTGNATSGRALLTVYYAPSIKTQPTNKTVNVGEKATFTITVNNGNPSATTYQWQYRTSTTGTWANCTSTQGTGYNTASFTTVTTTMGMNGYEYRCIIGNAQYLSSQTSNAATLTVNKLNVTSKVNMVGYTYGGTKSTPSVTGNTGNGTVTYYYNTTNSNTNGANWSTVTSSTSLNAGTYYMYAVIGATTNYNGSTTAAVPFIVAKRDVTIKPKDATKVYDTLPLTSNVAEVTAGSLVSGHTVTITTTGSITNVGSTENTISTLTIKNASGTDVTANYNVTKAKGTLTITAISANFNITLDNDTFEYDGTEKEPEVTIKVDGKTLEEGTDYEVSYKDNVDAGTATVTITGKGNYEGSTGNKEFTITKRLLEITAGSKEKIYDGTPLTSSAFSITSGTSLAPNQTLSATTSGTITNVGTTSNIIATYSIYHAGENVTSNYSITLKEGILEVKPATITGNVIIKGTNRVGKTLTAEVTVNPNDASLTYVWYYGTTNDINNATAITGANTKTYSPTSDKIGMYIFVKVVASKTNYNNATFTDITDNENNKVEKVGDRLTPYLMEREVQTVTTDGVTSEKAGYAIGAYRAGKTKYTSDLIKSITIINLLETNAPTTYETMWDASKDLDESVYAWVIKNNSSMYDLYIGGEGTLVVTSGKRLFADYTKCDSINGLDKMNTENVTDMSYMFSNLSAMNSLNVTAIKTSSVTNMEGMFMNNNVTTLNVTGFDTSKVTNMSKMFKNNSKLTSLNIKGFNTASATNMSQMFMNCSEITVLDVSAFNTNKVTNMSGMFMGMSKIESIGVTNFNTTNVTDMSMMFANCLKVQRLDLHTFNTAKVTNMNSMFTANASMKSILLGEEFNKLNGSNMFVGCSSLRAIIAQKKIKSSSEAVTLNGTDTGLNTLSNAVLYVPNLESKGYYETATNYMTVFGEARVKPILEIIGANPTYVTVGNVYVDPGAKVAGFEEANASEYTVYGYTLTTSGLPVDTTTVGTKLVIYTVKYKDQIVVTGATW